MTAATLRRSATRVTCACDSLSFGGGHQGYRNCGRGARLATDIDGMAAMGARAATLAISDAAPDVTGAALLVTTVRSLDDRQGSLRFIRCLPSAAGMCLPPRMSAGVESTLTTRVVDIESVPIAETGREDSFIDGETCYSRTPVCEIAANQPITTSADWNVNVGICRNALVDYWTGLRCGRPFG